MLWLIAGPNGSGKSTFARTGVLERLSATPETKTVITYLNADEVTRRLHAAEPGQPLAQLNLRAAQEVDRQVDELIEASASFAVETVLSSDKYIPRLTRARQEGYWIGLIYVLLNNPELNVARVAQRVSQGGHDVPAEKIRSRWARSLERLPVVARMADALSVWDNSSAMAGPELVIEATADRLFVAYDAPLLARLEEAPPPLQDAIVTLIDDLTTS